MSSCLSIGGLVILADSAAWVLSAQSGDGRWAVYITSGTTMVVALCGALAFIAPHVGKAITTLGASIMPALAEIHRQREEILKGSLSARIEDLKRSLEDKADDLADTQRKAALDLKEAHQKAAEELAEVNRKYAEERAEIDRKHDEDLKALRKHLHDVRDEMNTDRLQRLLDIQVRDEQIATLQAKIAELKASENKVAARQAVGQAKIDSALMEHREAIRETKDALVKLTGMTGEFPAYKGPGPVAEDEGGKTAG